MGSNMNTSSQFGFILINFLLSNLCTGCTISCNTTEGYRPCVDNVWGWIRSDCSGFLGCVHSTQPCAGHCPPELPIIGPDGQTCSECQGDGNVCPQCEEGEVWCEADQVCKLSTSTCGGLCPSVLFPVLNQTTQECAACPQYFLWCQE